MIGAVDGDIRAAWGGRAEEQKDQGQQRRLHGEAFCLATP